ncbi:PREDICTED: transmembrane protein 88B [Myotis davidii]|uniref:transmembrane protein 88B n=1 Tax=Myotis davidii TaxID=225400 RepID=UPI0007672F75|nr:PREDICTED: transmembrane protein 88B [Myotis davidii]
MSEQERETEEDEGGGPSDMAPMLPRRRPDHRAGPSALGLPGRMLAGLLLHLLLPGAVFLLVLTPAAATIYLGFLCHSRVSRALRGSWGRRGRCGDSREWGPVEAQGTGPEGEPSPLLPETCVPLPGEPFSCQPLPHWPQQKGLCSHYGDSSLPPLRPPALYQGPPGPGQLGRVGGGEGSRKRR